jgi:hypothetical protein
VPGAESCKKASIEAFARRCGAVLQEAPPSFFPAAQYHTVSLRFAPCPDQKSIGFICRIKPQTLNDQDASAWHFNRYAERS